MIISGSFLKSRFNNTNIVNDFDEKFIKYSSYSMRAGKFFVPKGNGEWSGEYYKLLPGNVIIVETFERVNLPKDLCAMYSIKQSKASEGLLLVNACMVEPGYSGKLSCFIINVSSQAVMLKKREPISKITFFEVSGTNEEILSQVIKDEDYSLALAKTAQSFDEKFLSINKQISNVIKDEVGKSRNVQFLFVFLLITVATIAPYFSNHLLSYKLPQKDYDVRKLEELYEAQELRLKDSIIEIKVLREELQNVRLNIAGDGDDI